MLFDSLIFLWKGEGIEGSIIDVDNDEWNVVVAKVVFQHTDTILRLKLKYVILLKVNVLWN